MNNFLNCFNITIVWITKYLYIVIHLTYKSGRTDIITYFSFPFPRKLRILDRWFVQYRGLLTWLHKLYFWIQTLTITFFLYQLSIPKESHRYKEDISRNCISFRYYISIVPASTATQQAMPTEIGGNWGTECLNTV